MKYLLAFLTILTITIGQLNAQGVNEFKELILDEDDPTFEAFDENLITIENNQRISDIYNLQKAKFKLINGDLKQAEFYLNRISEIQSQVVAVKKRYLGTIYFLQGKFNDSLNTLNNTKLNNNYINQICLLKLLNYMALNKNKEIMKEKDVCMLQTAKFSKNNQFWLETMVALKNQNKKGIDQLMNNGSDNLFSRDEDAKIWLKTGLYLNQEKELLSYISTLSESSYQSKRLREIIAFLYLRSGEPKKALAFIEDIDTANAENIKGTINLNNKEYELAFGHFRLALQKKQDSNNALERAIPLSWLLGQWADGLSMLNNISNPTVDKRNAHALKIAFLIREKRFKEAANELILLKISFQNEPPFEVSIMDSYVGMMLGESDRKIDRRNSEELTEKACKAFDGLSCWVALQYIQWENLGKTIKRNEPTMVDQKMTLESLKEKQEITPLKEDQSIDQSYIEELDGASIAL